MAGIEPAVSGSKQPQPQALGRGATGIGNIVTCYQNIFIVRVVKYKPIDCFINKWSRDCKLVSSTQYHCMSKCSSVSNILSPSEEFWWKHKNISYCGSVFSIVTYYPIYVGRVAQSVYRLSYGLDGPGSKLDGDEIFHPFTPAVWPTQPPVKWVPGLSRG